MVQAAGLVEILCHPQTNGRATGKTPLDLEPPGGRRGAKRERRSGRGEARRRGGADASGTRSTPHAADGGLEPRRCGAHKVEPRGKAAGAAARGQRWEAGSRSWKGGEVLG